jgi:hypothetical protein
MAEEGCSLRGQLKRVLDALKFSEGLGHPSDRRFAVDALEWLYDQGEKPVPEAIVKYLSQRGWDKATCQRAEAIWEIVVDLKDKQTGKRSRMFDPINL